MHAGLAGLDGFQANPVIPRLRRRSTAPTSIPAATAAPAPAAAANRPPPSPQDAARQIARDAQMASSLQDTLHISSPARRPSSTSSDSGSAAPSSPTIDGYGSDGGGKRPAAPSSDDEDAMGTDDVDLPDTEPTSNTSSRHHPPSVTSADNADDVSLSSIIEDFRTSLIVYGNNNEIYCCLATSVLLHYSP